MSPIEELPDEELDSLFEEAIEPLLTRFDWKDELLRTVRVLQRGGKRNVTFSVFRHGDISETHNALQVNPPDEIQFDGVIFKDNTTVIHWNTAIRSTSVFKDFGDLLDIHGHPEEAYATEFKFEGEE